MKQLYEDRANIDPFFGAGSKQQIPDKDSTRDTDLTLLDEKDLYQHQQKCMGSMGCYLAFRGSREHTYLTPAQLVVGTSEKGHELEGKPFVKVDNLIDKSHKLSIHNALTWKTQNYMRILANIDDIGYPRGTIVRYKTKYICT